MKKAMACLTLIALGIASVVLLGPVVLAIKECDGSDTVVCTAAPSDLTGGVLKSVISVLLSVAGIIAVIMIVIGAIRYITSDGDPGKATTARMTVIYAVVGLVIAVMSFGIVNFVIGKL